ncbi:unnamed protein product [Leuciscus chuanchicus]
MEHDYAMEVSVNSKRERGEGSLPATPSKNPAEKRVKPTADREKAEISNEIILEAILKLKRRVDEKLADLSEQSKQSSAMIASLTKVNNTEEVNECKKRVKDLEIQDEHLRKDNRDLKERILTKFAPEMEEKMEEAFDIGHRLGRRMDNKNRNVIVLFIYIYN